MTNATGVLRVTVGGAEYKLFLGFSGLTALQERHGSDFIQRLQPPAGADDGWLPDLTILSDLIMESLERYHAEAADRWLVDDIWQADPEIHGKLLEAAFPDQVQTAGGQGASPSGNAKRPRRKA